MPAANSKPINEGNVLLLGEAADRLGVEVWQLRRLFERGLLPAARRIGPFRVLAARDLPRIKKALCGAGYLHA